MGWKFRGSWFVRLVVGDPGWHGTGRAGIMEHRLIRRAMEHTGGNKTKAAQLLELSYPALLSKLKEYGL